MYLHVCASNGGLHTVLKEGKVVEMICNPTFLLQTPLEPKMISWLVSCLSLRIKLIAERLSVRLIIVQARQALVGT